MKISIKNKKLYNIKLDLVQNMKPKKMNLEKGLENTIKRLKSKSQNHQILQKALPHKHQEW